jgi:hypothetical protein
MVIAEYIIHRCEMGGQGRREDGDWRQDAAGVYPMGQEMRREDKTCPDGRKKRWKEERIIIIVIVQLSALII